MTALPRTGMCCGRTPPRRGNAGVRAISVNRPLARNESGRSKTVSTRSLSGARSSPIVFHAWVLAPRPTNQIRDSLGGEEWSAVQLTNRRPHRECGIVKRR